ncbi:extensin family protein [Mesorhizobium sp. WSM2239]|uniref:Extensin family protein n=2 Tax=unclassified Mesorhizobium TaxID=325217 RepID=A0AAU8DDD5_9HYPH
MVVVDAITSPLFVRTRQLALLVAVTVLCGGPVYAQTPDLPEKAPVPEIYPPPAGNIPPERPGEPPVPEPKPANEPAPDTPSPDGLGPEKPGPPSQLPAPAESPTAADDAPLPEQKPDGTTANAPQLPEIPADPRSAMPRFDIIPPDETACRARLRTLGVVFEERPAQSDPAGCALPYPLAVTKLSPTISLEPEALMNCAMAEAAARFAADIVSPAAKAEYGEELQSIGHASAYVCRPRNGGEKLSEHAFGNALDISRFTLSKGTAVDVEPAPDPKAAKFLGAIRKAACGPFKTVLGPGSDADHALHFHFDLAPRRNGGTFCQ